MPKLTISGGNVERIGHRGAPRRFLENTQPAFEEALRQGADAVELDVHVTADGHAIVHHDPGLSGRVTPAELRKREISELSLADVQGVDLGNGERIPLLAHVLEMVRGKATAYVEIKAGDIIPIAEVIKASGAVCAIHSFDHSAIAAAAQQAPEIPRGVLFDEWPPSPRAIVERTGARDVWPRATLISEARMNELHDLGSRVIAWTVNDPMLAKQLKAWAIDGLCTDDLHLI
jgi:glycerophosphoryl diester phosphodiesterase